MKTLTVGQQNIVVLEFQDNVTGTYPTDATIVLNLLDASFNPVPNGSNIAAPYVTPIYRGILPSTITLTDGATYYLRVQITHDGVVSTTDVTCVAQALAVG